MRLQVQEVQEYSGNLLATHDLLRIPNMVTSLKTSTATAKVGTGAMALQLSGFLLDGSGQSESAGTSLYAAPKTCRVQAVGFAG